MHTIVTANWVLVYCLNVVYYYTLEYKHDILFTLCYTSSKSSSWLLSTKLHHFGRNWLCEQGSICVITSFAQNLHDIQLSLHQTELTVSNGCINWTKSFLKENKHIEGWKPQKPTKLDGNQWHYNTFTPSLHLVPFCRHLHKYAMCFSCVQKRVVGMKQHNLQTQKIVNV